MKKSNNMNVNTLLRFIDNNVLEEINLFIANALNRNYYEFSNEEEINNYFKKYINKFYNNHNFNDTESLKCYTGISYKDINAILRNNWNYEINGRITENRKKEIYNLINNLDNVMNNLDNISIDMKTYRGVSIETFKDYNIHNINDLTKLKEDYLYDNGYTSTSLLKSSSYFNRDLEYHNECNILIEYLIPHECEDGIPLITDELSYSKGQLEFLLNRDCLSKVINVKINESSNKAYLKVLYIPRRIWDISHKKEENNIRKR